MTYRLYNDDCLNTLQEFIKRGELVDCIITDPPYRVTSRGSSGTTGGMFKKSINKDGKVFEHNDIKVGEYAKLFYDVLKDGSHCYVMTNHVNLIEMLNTFTDVGFHFVKSLIWNKGNKIVGQYYMSQFEYILFFRKGRAKRINNCGTSDVLNVKNIKTKENGVNLHDTEKPVELVKILVENSTKLGDVVLDPFMGIGSTVLACIELNIDVIGVELDQHYFNIVTERLKEVVK